MDNPFLTLFENTPGPSQPATSSQPATPPQPATPVEASASPPTKTEAPRLQSINQVIENTFLFTLNPYGLLGRPDSDPVTGLVFLQGISGEIEKEEKGRNWIDVDILDRVLFNRLMLTRTAGELEQSALYKESKKKNHNEMVTEPKIVTYLAQSYLRLQGEKTKISNDPMSVLSQDDFAKIQKEILSNISIGFEVPMIFEDQKLVEQFRDVLVSENPILVNFLTDLMEHMLSLNLRDTAMFVVLQLLAEIHTKIRLAPLMTAGGYQVTQLLKVICKSTPAAEIFISYNSPMKKNANGWDYAQTLLGTLLTKSCLPDSDSGSGVKKEYFGNVLKESSSMISATERNIWSGLDALRTFIYEIFNLLLRNSRAAKHKTLRWIGDCFKANAPRGKLWASETGPSGLNSSNSSDGFFLNLSDVLLRFCQPFCKGANNQKVLKIDPAYMAQEFTIPEQGWLRHAHLRDAAKETSLLPRDPDHKAPVHHELYNFVTDIFFLTHKSLDLGLRVCHEKLMKINQELGRQQQMYRELQAYGGTPEMMQIIEIQLEVLTQTFLTMKTALLTPTYQENLVVFSAATSTWLNQMALRRDESLSTVMLPLNFPLNSKEISPVLKYIPEFIIENIIEQILLAKRFCPFHLEEQGEYLGPIFELILMYMGSRTWINNPHLRAKMAECLEALLPRSDQQGLQAPVFNREQLFIAHPHRLEVVSTVLHVFVDIEMTGQSVQFEMKFNYRRPMYEIIKYVWEMDEYKAKFLALAHHAEDHINDEDAPLFLRFVNLLINDSIYLLDEGLNYIKQVQTFQEQQPSWSQLPAEERANNESQYSHIGRLARFHNIMGLETIQILDDLSREIKAVFTHPAMVDRIAAMLNYFLKNLVGPQRKSFKVKNLLDYSFKPGEIVNFICKIYINFSECESFLVAVSQDGRSYSQSLFSQAEDVLTRIGHIELISPLQDVAEKIRKSSETQKTEEELFADAPEHYLDAIMSILMRDPVKLPASGQVVDRSTIARHLLSDQNDPFTRAPLTMDMVIPQTDLKEEIQEWINQKKNPTL